MTRIQYRGRLANQLCESIWQFRLKSFSTALLAQYLSLATLVSDSGHCCSLRESQCLGFGVLKALSLTTRTITRAS